MNTILFLILLCKLLTESILLLFGTVSFLCKRHLASEVSLPLELLFAGSFSSRISADGSVGVGVHRFDRVRCNSLLDVLRELLLEGVFIRVGQRSHVFTDILPENVSTVDFGVEFI